MLTRLQKGKKLVGLRQSQKAVASGMALEAFVAGDADLRIAAGFLQLCEKHGIPVSHVKTMSELGRACGIGIGAGFAVLVKESD